MRTSPTPTLKAQNLLERDHETSWRLALGRPTQDHRVLRTKQGRGSITNPLPLFLCSGGYTCVAQGYSQLSAQMLEGPCVAGDWTQGSWETPPVLLQPPLRPAGQVHSDPSLVTGHWTSEM